MNLRQAAQIAYPAMSAETRLKLVMDEMEQTANGINAQLVFKVVNDSGENASVEFEVFYNTNSPFNDYFTTLLLEVEGESEPKITGWTYNGGGFEAWLLANDPRGAL